MAVNKNDKSSPTLFTEPLTVFLDSASPSSYLPPHIIQPLIDVTQATPYDSSLYSVSCENENPDVPTFSGSVDFGFGNLTIRVPMQQLTWVGSGDLCVLGIGQTSNPHDIPYVLGENFLRSAFG